MKQVMRKEIDMVAAWSVDRLRRSLQHLVGVLSDLQARNVGLYLHVQGLDTTTPSGRAMYQMLGVFAEFEREMIRERVLAGIDRARARGKRLGRPRSPMHRRRRCATLWRKGWAFGRPLGRRALPSLPLPASSMTPNKTPMPSLSMICPFVIC
ncbi:recombinase family protein [Rhodobacter capsulatus]|uniref:recombinase family protein n=1 Tax=Rhodobacter capsulatus TaxID=1061 RepID=UPI0023E2D966|nr:recombinase family protein [Rhodobacter capsulatus]WER08366.1 recombinase family protein [Rhodobacter capsulatus]